MTFRSGRQSRARETGEKNRKWGRFPHSVMNQCTGCKKVLTAKEAKYHRC